MLKNKKLNKKHNGKEDYLFYLELKATYLHNKAKLKLFFWVELTVTTTSLSLFCVVGGFFSDSSSFLSQSFLHFSHFGSPSFSTTKISFFPCFSALLSLSVTSSSPSFYSAIVFFGSLHLSS